MLLLSDDVPLTHIEGGRLLAFGVGIVGRLSRLRSVAKG